jgi:hypothetical protein
VSSPLPGALVMSALRLAWVAFGGHRPSMAMIALMRHPGSMEG